MDPESGAPLSDRALARKQQEAGLTALAGDVLVVPTFTSDLGAPQASASLALQFLDAKTGKTVGSQPVPEAAWFDGVDALTIGGKPAVEVRYVPKPSAITGPLPRFASEVFDTTGKRLWTSTGQKIASGAAGPDPGLSGGDTTGLVRDGGYLVRHDSSDPADYFQRKAGVSVLDLSGRTLLTVPDFAAFDQADATKTIRNRLQVIGGYAVVMTVDGKAAGSPSPDALTRSERFTVYDLAHGAKQIAGVAEPALPNIIATPNDAWAQVLSSCGGKLLLAWSATAETGGSGTGSTLDLAVLDARTGRATPSIAVPSGQPGNLSVNVQAMTDHGCTGVQVTGVISVGRTVDLAVDWAHGSVLWQHADHSPGYQPPTMPTFKPQSAAGGTVYGWQGFSGSATAIGLSDGKTRSGGFSLMPVAFTSDGSPVFLQIDGARSVDATSPPATSTTTASPKPAHPAPVTYPDLYSVTVWVGKPAA